MSVRIPVLKEAVVPVYVQFSRDKYIMEGTPEKLRKELEEELKMGKNLIQRDGDFLIRDSLSSPGNYVLTCQWKNSPQHFKINKMVVAMNEAYSRVQYLFEKEGFDSVPALVRYYVGNRKPVTEVVGAIIFQPINRALPLRCLEEKYGVACVRVEAGLTLPERKSQTSKRLSLNIMNGHTQDQSLGRGNLLRNKDKCGSQPACSRPQPQSQLMEHQPRPQSPVFRTGSEQALSPTVPRRLAFETQAGEAIRGSESQLCPKPPPKPSKVPSMRIPRSPRLQPLAPLASPAPGPPVPPLKPKKQHLIQALQPPQPPCPEVNYFELSPCSPAEWDRLQAPGLGPQPNNNNNINSYVERLRTEESERSSRGSKLDRSSYHHAIEALENGSEEEEVEQERKGEIEETGEEKERSFRRPVLETASAFQPGEFESRLLPAENKPLEMSVLKRAKGLLVQKEPHIIAMHILMADCQVARVLGVSEEVKGQMGVSSGLELVTLPHGRQLRRDLMERHHTMAIGVAVDILGCTGSLEERTATLNRIIMVALELKDSMGDLYAFSSIMKALDMPQITRLDHTWTMLRRKYTQTAIIYEKSLKPFYKGLYEGTADMPLTGTTMPLLMPLLILMERQAVAFEGMELWESNDQGCEIMLRHLDEARSVAHNADAYTANTEHVLKDFQADEDLLEIFKTDFQLRLLWGSRGAAVNQMERYDKFTLILTALSRKLEPAVKHTEL
ncbi:unnamed protein product [Coregonus sp. 'balchen']|nr:unnamed protein product [Coregonus sp. 'balchen']